MDTLKFGGSPSKRLRTTLGLLGLAVAAISLVACSAPATPGGDATAPDSTASSAPVKMTDIVLQSYANPAGDLAPFLYGISEGIYKQHGINLTFRYFDSVSGIQAIVSGAANLALDRPSPIVAANSAGEGVKVVMGIVEVNPFAILVPESSNIKTLDDLKGKTIAVGTGSSTGAILTTFLKKHGFQDSDIVIQALSASAGNGAFVAGKVDAIVKYAAVISQQYAAQGVPVREFPIGQDVPSFYSAIAVTDSYLAANKDVVQAFVTATQEAYAAAKANPAAAAAALKADAGTAAADVDVLQQQLEDTLGDWSTPATQGKPIGYIDAGDWKATVDSSNEYDSAGYSGDPADLYTNEFIGG